MTKVYDIAVVGDWHLAFVTASVLADVGHKVALVNPLLSSEAKPWSSFPTIPVMEPGLNEMIQKNTSEKRLHFENGVTSEWQSSIVWMAVDTPVNDQDEPDVEPLLKIIHQIKDTQKSLNLFVTSSQIPIGFCAGIEKTLKKPVAYVPENLRLGKGIETFFQADRTVIGGSTPTAAESVQTLLKKFPTQFLLCNLVTAEMVKHANNIFLATSISFANELARIGEIYGADSQTVAKALKLDKRIGPAAYVAPGLGFAGGTLPRDLRVIQKIGQKEKVPTPLVDGVLQVNENTTAALADIILKHIQEYDLPKRVLILGYTYKADTDTLRRSLSLDLASLLKKSSLEIDGLDPIMNGKDISRCQGLLNHHDNENTVPTPSVVVCMTARPAFKEINWNTWQSRWKLTAANKVLVLDTQNILNKKQALESQFYFKQLWGPLENPT